MGQSSIKSSLTFLDTRESPLGPAPVYKLEAPPHCFVQRFEVAGHEAERKRLQQYQDIRNDHLC